ncbi:lecithin retinol acyltransferase family protein [Pseudomonas sp. P115]|uniref:lecithin retinol acyltransferase family protein n=1 Tax=Pseudomonas pisciculturae TaxID=2730413 RepID=UPI0018927CDE|nr:lecithin retinol acyltransferase family protein [Pseudomonas pisciculturae]MBF6029692.1 lecithin retinol acyltransferase family protein [Pseudomonas pisciculturae]
MRRGDHLVSVRLGYTHHGIYIGSGEVIHYSGFGDSVSGPICRASLDKFSGGMPTVVTPHLLAVHDAEERIARGYTRLGEDSYNLLTNNCEHFVSWCIYGTNSSEQVRSVFSSAGRTLAHIVPGISAVATVVATGSALKNGYDAASGSDKPIEAALKVTSKSALLGAATVISGPIGWVGVAAVFAAKKILTKK